MIIINLVLNFVIIPGCHVKAIQHDLIAVAVGCIIPGELIIADGLGAVVPPGGGAALASSLSVHQVP